VRVTLASAETASGMMIFAHRMHEETIEPISLDDDYPSKRSIFLYLSRAATPARNFFAIF
jgi:hypothetical protein